MNNSASSIVSTSSFNVGLPTEFSETVVRRGDKTWYVNCFVTEGLTEVYRYDGGRKAEDGEPDAYAEVDALSIWDALI